MHSYDPESYVTGKERIRQVGFREVNNKLILRPLVATETGGKSIIDVSSGDTR
jgi:hypothetical protein